MILEGKVSKGIGCAEYWVEKIKDVFKQKVEMDLFPGTLNIKLESEYQLSKKYLELKKEQYGGTENISFQRCKIFNEEAYIVRAEKNSTKTGDHLPNIIEIISDVNFRKKYKLVDGDKVIIEIEE